MMGEKEYYDEWWQILLVSLYGAMLMAMFGTGLFLIVRFIGWILS
jgi:hypothetical protein